MRRLPQAWARMVMAIAIVVTALVPNAAMAAHSPLQRTDAHHGSHGAAPLHCGAQSDHGGGGPRCGAESPRVDVSHANHGFLCCGGILADLPVLSRISDFVLLHQVADAALADEGPAPAVPPPRRG
jgi:hypothetical protein